MNIFKPHFTSNGAIVIRFSKNIAIKGILSAKSLREFVSVDTEMLPAMKYFLVCNYFLIESRDILFIVGPRQCEAQTKKASKLISERTYRGVRTPVAGVLCTLKT